MGARVTSCQTKGIKDGVLTRTHHSTVSRRTVHMNCSHQNEQDGQIEIDMDWSSQSEQDVQAALALEPLWLQEAEEKDLWGSS